ncbi:MAG TPA: L,D-transpeptidase [Polyangiaceae bacterium]|nr:L,D-transpeptidase [Polyangiaceae bacterium]
MTALLALLAACAEATPPQPPEQPSTTSVSRAPVLAAQSEPSQAKSVPDDKDSGPRVTSIRDRTWIWREPKVEGERWLGYIRVGQSVRLRAPEKVRGIGCSQGFFAIEPRGYVCHDKTVTLERDTPFLRANAHAMPRSDSFPYEWAISSGAPMYARLPTPEEQQKTEWRYGKAGEHAPLAPFQRGHEHLAVTDPIAPNDPLPEFLKSRTTARGGKLELLRRSIPHGSMLSYTRAFEHEGRTFVLSADLTLVPADRLRRFRRSNFRGIELGSKVKLPLAWFRVNDRPQYRRAGDDFEKSGKSWPVRSYVELTGREERHERRTYLEVKGGAWVDAEDATVVRARDRRPFGVAPDEKWMIVSISQGTLVAYEDLEPVFTTLISPGQGGIPRPGGDLVKDSTTPLGNYRITFKDRATTMSPEIGVKDRTFWIADVPFTQYFRPPFAVHATYWHEKFGELMSGGCINASPIDAAWLFRWTEPHVPDGWQGAVGAGAKENGKASWIVVTR